MKLRIIALSLWCVLSAISPNTLMAEELVSDYSWAEEHHDACVDQLLGSHKSFVGRQFSNSLVVTARVVDDVCGERQIAIIEQQPAVLQIRVSRVMGGPVLEQLLALHEDAPELSPEILCGKIAAESTIVISNDTAPFLGHVGQLREARFELTPRSLAVIHGVDYTVWITSGQWEVEFRFGDVREEEARSALASWVERALRTAGVESRGCGAAPK